MSESEQSRAQNTGKAVSGSANKNWSKAAGYGLIGSFLGLGKNDRFADRGRMKSPQEWDNEIRAHELRQDINHYYGSERAKGDLQRSIEHLDAMHERTPDGRLINNTEYNGKGGYKVAYGNRQAPAEEPKEEVKKAPAKRGARKPAAKKPAAKKPAAKPAAKKPAAKTPAAKKPAAKGKENPGKTYFNPEQYP
jgi:hypothetical protein